VATNHPPAPSATTADVESVMAAPVVRAAAFVVSATAKLPVVGPTTSKSPPT